MATPLQSLIATGTKLWLDGVHPADVKQHRNWGATGATSNPQIISDLLAQGDLNPAQQKLLASNQSDEAVAWAITDDMVREAQQVFDPLWVQTGGNDGYVSFELDPLIEDSRPDQTHDHRVRRYVELGRKWSAGHRNRMIKVPATAAGVAALEELASQGVPLNVTLCFTRRQYEAARDAIWRGIQRSGRHANYKSVYSIFVSRIDVYASKHIPKLSAAAQGMVGIVNARRIWQLNQTFWADKNMKLEQDIVFASTSVKDESSAPDLYVQALAGGGIQTNPPQTNQWVQQSGKTYQPQLNASPGPGVEKEIDTQVDMDTMETALIAEGISKFAKPQRKLLEIVAALRRQPAK